MNASILTLSPAKEEDLYSFFRFQTDAEGIHLAAFTPKNPKDERAYIEKFTRLLSEPTVHMETVRVGEIIIGSISKFIIENEAEITYWFDREYWGKGIGTKVLQEFLLIEHSRPLHARVAFDNFGSQRVLEKNGFIKIGTDKGYANARQAEIEEFIYKLSN